MQAVAAHRDYTRIFHNCQANNETFLKFFYGCRGTRTPKGIPAPAIFKIVSSSSQITPFFLPTVVNRGTFSQSRLKQFHESPHDSYHDYKRNNFSNLAETVGFEPTELLIIVRLVSNELLSTTQPSLQLIKIIFSFYLQYVQAIFENLLAFFLQRLYRKEFY